MEKDNAPRRSEFIGKVLSYLVSLTTILGVPVALYGYFAAQQQSRVDRTFAFYKDFLGSARQDDVNMLVQIWNAKANDAQQFLAKNDQAGLTKLQTALLQEAKASAAIIRIVEFYDGVGTCVANGLCDNATAYALLHDPAYQIVAAYGGYLSTVGKSGTPFASGIFVVSSLPTSAANAWWRF